MARRTKLNIRACPIILLVMFYGIAAYKLQWPPYHFLTALYDRVFLAEDEGLRKEYLETDVARLITITQRDDVSKLRGQLIGVLWGAPGLPQALPSTVAKGFTDARYNDIAALGSIDKLVITMDFGLESNAYHFIPRSPNNKVVLYHQGHDGDFHIGKAQIAALLKSGYSVVAFSMPLLGSNNQPTVDLPRQGKLKLTSHDQMVFLSPAQGNPVKYFIEPVVVALNYLAKHYTYGSVSMVGISGGGWTTTLAAAIDTRIGKSFPVAGSYPIYLRSNAPKDWGDYEEVEPKIYNTVNYLELYVLGSYGLNRKQLQVINKYDTCCYSGTKWETYKEPVRARVRELGEGEFDLFLDDTHREHQISERAMQRILDELGNDQR